MADHGEAAPDGRGGALASLPFAVLLFVIWVVLSGKLDEFHLGIGALTSLLVARFARDLLTQPPIVGVSLAHPLGGVDWWRALAFVPWLALEVARSSVQVARVVFDPKLPIDPEVVRFKSGLPHTLARLGLAHSITLTPGTVTLDVENDELIVHALTRSAADDIRSGTMEAAVSPVFRPASPLRDPE